MDTKTPEEVNQLAQWVIKSYTNKSKFDTWNEFNIRDKSIGIHYGIFEEISSNITDEQLKNVNTQIPLSNINRKQIIDFMNIKINDWIIIARGAKKSLYIAQIASSYYYQELDGDDNNEFCRHRKRLKNISKIDASFERRYCIKTIVHYNSVYN